jgi:hypothetical protein
LFFELYHTRKNGIIYLKNNHIQHLENKIKKNYFIEKIKKLKKEIEEYNLSIKIYKKIKDKYKIYSVIDENINKEIKIMGNYKDSAKKEIASLEKEIEYVDQLIDKIISLRDISKLIIAFEKGTLHVLSQYIVYPKTSYIQILEDFSKVVEEHNEKSEYQIEIDSLAFHMDSIFDSEIMVKRLKDKVEKHIKYNKQQFFMRKIGFENMKFYYNELSELRKYSDKPILHEKKYLKEKDKKSIEKIISDLEKEFPD